MQASQKIPAPLTVGTLGETLSEFIKLGAPRDAIVKISKTRDASEYTFEVAYPIAGLPMIEDPDGEPGTPDRDAAADHGDPGEEVLPREPERDFGGGDATAVPATDVTREAGAPPVIGD